jgi:hypothetical protein
METESRAFHRSFAAGAAALAIAISGQVLTSRSVEEAPPCPMAVRTLYARVSSHSTESLAQRVARAVIGAMLSGFC